MATLNTISEGQSFVTHTPKSATYSLYDLWLTGTYGQSKM